MKVTKTYIGLAALAALFALQGCYRSESNDSLNKTVSAFPVEIAVVLNDTSVKNNYYIGSVEAAQTIPVSFATAGTVESVYAVEGQFVSKGAVLAQLNTTMPQSALNLSLATEKQARDAYERLSKVYKEGSLPEIKFVDIETKLQQAISSTEIARKNLNDCTLKSPVSAMVGKRNIEPGSSAMPVGAAFTLYKIDEVLVKVSVQENDISRFKKGSPAKIIVPALENMEFSGTVDEIGIVANIISHTYDVKIRIRNQQNMLKPGMICNVYMQKGSGSLMMTIPNNAVISEGGKNFVYVPSVDKRSVTKRPIITGSYSGNNIVVVEGLSVGENIVVKGWQKLYDGAPITVLQ